MTVGVAATAACSASRGPCLVEPASRYALLSADASFIGEQGCAQIDCDGRRNSLIVDEDGCEVFEDNYELVEDGAILVVSLAESLPPPALPPLAEAAPAGVEPPTSTAEGAHDVEARVAASFPGRPAS